MPREFKGTIKLDVRDSKQDWDAFLATKSPKDAPNVLVILYDDTGQAAWSPYGRQGRNAGAGSAGEKRTHLYAVAYDRRLLADPFVLPHGAQPSQNGYGTISEAATGFPGYNGHIRLSMPPSRTYFAMPAGARSGLVRTIMCLSMPSTWQPRVRHGRSASATTASTDSGS